MRVGVGMCSGVGVSMGASIGEYKTTFIIYNSFIPHPNPKVQNQFGTVESSSITRAKLAISISACGCLRSWCLVDCHWIVWFLGVQLAEQITIARLSQQTPGPPWIY